MVRSLAPNSGVRSLEGRYRGERGSLSSPNLFLAVKLVRDCWGESKKKWEQPSELRELRALRRLVQEFRPAA
jgi:hypothetical protein